MFNRKEITTKPTALDEEIERLTKQMSNHDGHSEDYTHMAANLKVLMEAKATQPTKPTLSPDTIATVAGSILGILVIVGYERVNVVTSKGLSFVMKPKV